MLERVGMRVTEQIETTLEATMNPSDERRNYDLVWTAHPRIKIEQTVCRK